MNLYDLKKTSITLDNLKPFQAGAYQTIELKSFPQVSIPSLESSFLGGLNLATEIYSRKINYDEDVFAELPLKLFDESYNKQMATFLNKLRTRLNNRLLEMKNKRIMPKFYYSFNEDEKSELVRMSSEWDEGNAMLYFSFEEDSKESNFGMIWNDNKKQNYQSRSGNLYLNNNDEVIHEAVDFILRVY